MQFNQDSKVMVTEAGGFIGSRLVQKLSDYDSQVFSIVRDKKRQTIINPIQFLQILQLQLQTLYQIASL